MDENINQLLGKALNWLRERGRRRSLTLEDVGRLVGVSTSTVNRWVAGRADPGDERAAMRLIELYYQSRHWHMRVCPFVALLWSAGGRYSDVEPLHREGDLFGKVAFEPVNGASDLIRCTLRLRMSLAGLTLYVDSEHRDLITLHKTQEGLGDRALRLHTSQGDRLQKDGDLTFFMTYAI